MLTEEVRRLKSDRDGPGPAICRVSQDLIEDARTFTHANSTVQTTVRTMGNTMRTELLIASGAIQSGDDPTTPPQYAELEAEFKALLDSTQLTQAAKDAIFADARASFTEHYAVNP